MDWWDEREIAVSPSRQHDTEFDSPSEALSKVADIKAKIGCLPCQHASARGLFDRFKTLWASWYIESGGQKVYFAGYAS